MSGRGKAIPVRTRDEILAGQLIAKRRGDDALYVWVTCPNCGGSGQYASDQIPVGRCRYYCWANRTRAFYGKIPMDMEQFVRAAQAEDRARYREDRKWEYLKEWHPNLGSKP